MRRDKIAVKLVRIFKFSHSFQGAATPQRGILEIPIQFLGPQEKLFRIGVTVTLQINRAQVDEGSRRRRIGLDGFFKKPKGRKTITILKREHREVIVKKRLPRERGSFSSIAKKYAASSLLCCLI